MLKHVLHGDSTMNSAAGPSSSTSSPSLSLTFVGNLCRVHARRSPVQGNLFAMVTTRSKAPSGVDTGGSSSASSEDRAPGSRWWFTVIVGLNALGFIPGTSLGEEHVSKAEYEAFWGKKNVNNGGRYRRAVSPKMGKRIRYLFQRVFQRPIGANDSIPYHFGRGLLAERKGLPVDWAGYARKMTHRGTGDQAHIPGRVAPESGLMKRGRPFVFLSIEDLRKITPPNKWPRNEVDSDTDCEDGREDDWNINVRFGAMTLGVPPPVHTSIPNEGTSSAARTSNTALRSDDACQGMEMLTSF